MHLSDYNPKYWQDPETFDPERFLKPYNRAAFIPYVLSRLFIHLLICVRFGVGTRACLGKKFSEVESVCMLVHMLRNYSVHLPLRPGESVEDARRSFSKASVRITLTPEKVPLIFRRRTHKE
jgi:cytochrome P450